jgi:hypothetical protein
MPNTRVGHNYGLKTVYKQYGWSGYNSTATESMTRFW